MTCKKIGYVEIKLKDPYAFPRDRHHPCQGLILQSPFGGLYSEKRVRCVVDGSLLFQFHGRFGYGEFDLDSLRKHSERGLAVCNPPLQCHADLFGAIEVKCTRVRSVGFRRSHCRGGQAGNRGMRHLRKRKP